MRFINGKLIDISKKTNAALIFSYIDDLNPQISVSSSVELKKDRQFVVNVTYKIKVCTVDGELLNTYSAEYNFEVVKDDGTVESDRENIKGHLQIGLILFLNRTAGNDTRFTTAVLPKINLYEYTEPILNAFIQLDYYIL